ncbi:MAG: ribose-5-phosphate isomerase RpiA [Candidatus Thalassarchaeaceae archaeon]|jgi:ribose 5-phosphate isomerase A|nr:ribose-5-phosphate isomerase RpiA [Candidatus Thalassarchaeaceae archaeon]
MGEYSAAQKEAMKKEAGIAACDFVKSGMKVGLGTGSTVKYTILELGRRIREEHLDIEGIPTSDATELISIEQRIPLLNWEECTGLDIVIDGADEFDPNLNLIKGGGGALLREKIVAESSGGMVVVADASKQVDILGTFPLPIEVNPYGWEQTRRRIQQQCEGDVIVREKVQGDPFFTDNGNLILDAHFGPNIDAPLDLESALKEIAGVVEVGLFNEMADIVVLADPDGCQMIRKDQARI